MSARALRALLAACIVALSHAATQASAQPAPQDAPFVPTPQPVVEAMLRLAHVSARDVVYDLGSGDGRVVITAAKMFGARAVGVELDPHLIIQSEEAARQAGVERLTLFLEQDLFKVDLAPATVITLYLWPRMYDKLAPVLVRLRPGTRIVIYRQGFTGWKPDERGGSGEQSYFLYRVPAHLAGRWRVSAPIGGAAPREYEIEFRQRFQEIRAEARDAAGTVPVSEAKLDGDRIRFVLGKDAVRWSFEGQVKGSVAGGVVRSTGEEAGVAWHGKRVTTEKTGG
jgi:hypothetical protein